MRCGRSTKTPPNLPHLRRLMLEKFCAREVALSYHNFEKSRRIAIGVERVVALTSSASNPYQPANPKHEPHTVKAEPDAVNVEPPAAKVEPKADIDESSTRGW